MTDARSLARLLATLQQLKRTPRTGWLDRGVAPVDAESVADHTLLTAIVAWLVALEEPDLDADRVLKLALVHDFAEALVGDQPPYDAWEVPPPDDREAVRAFFSVRHLRSPENAAAKERAEQDAFAALTADLSPTLRDALGSLWQEYEARSTPEARFVKEVDTLEAYLQSRHHAQTDPTLPLSGFADMAAKELDHPRLTALRDETD